MQLVDTAIRYLDVLAGLFIVALLVQLPSQATEVELLRKGIELFLKVCDAVDPLTKLVDCLFGVL